jgi:hypothetical protein
MSKPCFSDLEPLVCTAADLSTALAMAIEGMGKLAMEDEDEIRGLQALASEAMYAAQEARIADRDGALHGRIVGLSNRASELRVVDRTGDVVMAVERDRHAARITHDIGRHDLRSTRQVDKLGARIDRGARDRNSSPWWASENLFRKRTGFRTDHALFRTIRPSLPLLFGGRSVGAR